MATQDDIDRIANEVADQIRAAFKTGSLGARTSTADRSSEKTTAEVKSLLLEWLGDKPYREDWVFQLVSASSLGMRHFSETLAERIIDEFAADTGNAVAPVLAQLEEEELREMIAQDQAADAEARRDEALRDM
jgi:hypothetical protein